MERLRHAIADKFDRVIEHLVFVEESAQRDDDVLAGDAGGKFPLSTTLATGGTCHQVTPVAQMLAASVRTTGVPSAADRAVQIRVRIAATTIAPGTT